MTDVYLAIRSTIRSTKHTPHFNLANKSSTISQQAINDEIPSQFYISPFSIPLLPLKPAAPAN
jgi:hypothetical protein